jgi:Putative esterase
VRELIPHLEERFRLIPRPEARLLTGHSSGGWSSLWLQLRWPEVFGGAWSSAPDPIDFRAFQRTDLYLDGSLYKDEGGEPTPSYRSVVGPGGETEVLMTAAEECGMEYAMHPLGGSGQQWDTWEAMFSPRDEATGFPVPMFDARTGAIDRELVETHWSRWDIARLVAADWERYGPILQQRVRLACGTLDSFYLERAVAGVKELVEARAEEDGGWQGEGFIRLVEGATHFDLLDQLYPLWDETMREHLIEHGLQSAEPPF